MRYRDVELLVAVLESNASFCCKLQKFKLCAQQENELFSTEFALKLSIVVTKLILCHFKLNILNLSLKYRNSQVLH